MILTLHIAVAIISILVITYAAWRPNAANLALSAILASTTLVSGGMLALQTPAILLHTCLVGLFYIVFLLVMAYIIRLRKQIYATRYQ